MPRTLTGRRRYARTLTGRLVLQVEECWQDLAYAPKEISLDQLDARDRIAWRTARLADIRAIRQSGAPETVVDTPARHHLLPLMKSVPGALTVQTLVGVIAWGFATGTLDADAALLTAVLSPQAIGLGLGALVAQAVFLFSASPTAQHPGAPTNGGVPGRAHDSPIPRHGSRSSTAY